MIDQNDERKIREIIEDRIKALRIGQTELIPDSVKRRHIGEGVRFVRAGTAANRPTSGEIAGAIYFATDTFVLSIWTGSAWKTTTLA